MSTKADVIWMPLYVTDYLGDTMHLSTEQHGAYLLLLMAAWQRGGKLPLDDAQLAAIARLSAAAWRKHKPVLMAFFHAAEDGIEQKRLVTEYEKSARIIETKRSNGKMGGRPKKQNLNETETITENKPTGSGSLNLQGNRRETQSQSQSELQDQTPAATHASAPLPDGLFRMHRDWVPGEHFSDSLVFAGLKDYPFDDDLPEFVLYWAGKSESLSHGSWEHKFISSMKRNAARREQAGNEPTRIPRNWRPSAELISALTGEGIPIDFLDAATTEFVAFWLEDGSAQRSWNAKFIQHVRTTFDRQPKPAPNAFDTLTDRSWADGILTLNALEQGDA